MDIKIQKLLGDYYGKKNDPDFFTSLKQILEEGEDPNLIGKYNQSILLSICMMQNIKESIFQKIVNLLMEYRINLDIKGKNNNTPLHYLCRAGYLEPIKFMIEKGVTIDNLNDEGQIAPFSICVGGGGIDFWTQCTDEEKFKTFQYLFEIYKDSIITHKDLKGNTLFHYACAYLPINIIKMFLDNNANIYLKNNAGMTPFIFGIRRGHPISNHYYHNISMTYRSNIEDEVYNFFIRYSETQTINTISNFIFDKNVILKFANNKINLPISLAYKSEFLRVLLQNYEDDYEDNIIIDIPEIIHEEDAKILLKCLLNPTFVSEYSNNYIVNFFLIN